MSETSSRRRGLPDRVKMRHDTHFVEELAARHSEPVGKMVPLAEIEPDPNQPRSAMGDLAELAASIRDKGILEPILVRPAAADESGRSRYRIISGERRYRAAMDAGLLEVPVIEMDVPEDEALEIALVENLQRKDLTPFEEAEGYRSLKERYDYTHEAIAAAVGRSRTVVTESLAILKMPPRAREAVQALGITSKSLILEVLKRGRDEQDMIRLLEQIAERGLTRDDLRRETRKPARGRPGPKAPTFKFRAPDKSYRLSLTFRRSTVDRDDLIAALEEILDQLRAETGSGKP